MSSLRSPPPPPLPPPAGPTLSRATRPNDVLLTPLRLAPSMTEARLDQAKLQYLKDGSFVEAGSFSARDAYR